MAEILNQRYPGFLETQEGPSSKAARSRPLALRLEDWIDARVFGVAKQEGRFNAIAYYAIREPRYQRAEVCWSECVGKWKSAKPVPYPTFDEWKAMAEQCDPTSPRWSNATSATLRLVTRMPVYRPAASD